MTVNTAQPLDEDYGKDSNYVRTYTRTYYVDATVDAGALQVEEALNLPKMGQPHPQDSGAYVNSISAKRSMDETLSDGTGIALRKWNVTINYSSDASSTFSPITQKQKRPWKLGAYGYIQDTKTYSKTLYRSFELDSENNWVKDIPVVNTAGDIINVQIEVNNSIIRFSYDILKFKSSWASEYVGSTNKTSITVAGDLYAQSEVRINKLSRKAKRWEDGTEYWSVDVELEVEGGIPVAYIQLLNAGYKFLNPDEGGKLRPIQLKDGVYGWHNDSDLNITEPVALTTGGAVIDLKSDPEGAVYLDFNTAIPQDWDVIGMPDKIEERI